MCVCERERERQREREAVERGTEGGRRSSRFCARGKAVPVGEWTGRDWHLVSS
jgi:hypothetical protein